MRARHFLLILLASTIVFGCQTGPKEEEGPAEFGWPGEVISYKKAVSPAHGIVGYVKEIEYRKDGHGEPFRIFHVIDLDFVERGVLNQSGTGVRFVDLPPAMAAVKGYKREEVPLEAHPLAYNVAVVLGVEEAGPVKLTKAEPEDLRRPE